MGEFFLGEIRVFSFSFAPQGWALCDGASMLIQQNQALYSLLGVYYGGNGTTNFNLPDLRGRTPIAVGTVQGRTTYQIGNKGGAENVQLAETTIPQHNHGVKASNQTPTTLTAAVPTANFPATVHMTDSTVPPSGHQLYGNPTNLVALNPGTVSAGGASAGHNNMQQVAVVNFCIATTGVYPPRQ